MAAALPEDGRGTAAAAVRRPIGKQRQRQSGEVCAASLAAEEEGEGRNASTSKGLQSVNRSGFAAGGKKKPRPFAKVNRRGKKNPKAQARDIRRLLRKRKETLPAAAAEELEERAAQLEKAAQQARKDAKRKRFVARKKELYDKIRFYEAQKVRRRLKTTRRLLQQLLRQQRQELQQQQQNASSIDQEALQVSIAEQQAALASHLSDLTYVLHYPPDEPYIALFPGGGDVSKETEEKREAMRLKIRQRIINERLGDVGTAAEDDDPSGGFILSAAEARQAAAEAAGGAASAEGKTDVSDKNTGSGRLQKDRAAGVASSDKEEKCGDGNMEEEAFSGAALFEQAPELSDAEEHREQHLKTHRKMRVPPHTLHTSPSSFDSSSRTRKNVDFPGRRLGGSRHPPPSGEKRGPAVLSDRSRSATTDERKTTRFPPQTYTPAANNRNPAAECSSFDKDGNKKGHANVHTTASADKSRSTRTSSTRDTQINALDNKKERCSGHETENRKKRKLGKGTSGSPLSSSSFGSPSGVASSAAPKRIGLSKSAAVGSHVIFESDSD